MSNYSVRKKNFLYCMFIANVYCFLLLRKKLTIIMRNRRQIIIALELFNKDYDICPKLAKWKFEAKKILNENKKDGCSKGLLPPLMSLSLSKEENDELQPFLDVFDEEDGDGLMPYIPQLFDNCPGFEDLSLNSLPPLDLDLINGETYAWRNLAEKAKLYGYEFEGEPYKLFQIKEAEVQTVNVEEAEVPVDPEEKEDVLEKLQDRNNTEETLEIEVLNDVYYEDENVNVNKEQIPHEKTRYLLPHQYKAGVDKYVLRYENPSSAAEDPVFDADIFLDADPLHDSELNEIVVVANEEIDADNELEEYDVSNSEELIVSNSQESTTSNFQEATASTSNELNVSNFKELNVSIAGTAEVELEQG